MMTSKSSVPQEFKGVPFRIFSKGTSTDYIKERFMNLFGYPPRVVQEVNGLIWAGPIEQKKED